MYLCVLGVCNMEIENRVIINQLVNRSRQMLSQFYAMHVLFLIKLCTNQGCFLKVLLFFKDCYCLVSTFL